MFEFKGTAAASKEGTGPEWRIVDHRNIQDLGRRPFTTMVLPTIPQRSKTEGARRPSPPLRSRSNSFAPTYSRPQDADDLAPVATSIYRPTPRLFVDRRSLSAGNPPAKGDSLDIFAPKTWMAKGSKLLKRENSKHELTSLRTLDWVEERREPRAHHVIGPPPPPELRRSRMRSTGDSNAVSQLHISEPFNFHHITHTQPHQVQKLDSANPEELVSEFSALRASQASQPQLRGINAKDIQREDLPRDALLPDCPSQLPSHHAALPPFPTAKIQSSLPDGAYGAMSPARILEYSRLTDNFSRSDAGYRSAQTSPMSPTFPPSSHYATHNSFTFHDDSLSDANVEPPVPTESTDPLDYPIGTWNDGIYDLASPHAVTTDDTTDWNRQVPFSMIKTELAPVEEDDENEEDDDSVLYSAQWIAGPISGTRNRKLSDLQGQSPHAMPPAEQSRCGSPTSRGEDVSDSLHEYCTPPARISEPFIEDPIDDIPIRPRFSRCISVGPNDMERFWDMASDAINCSYALGAEGDSNFDWHRMSTHGDYTTAPNAQENQTKAADAPSESPHKNPQPDSPSPNRTATKRSSSVYSSSSPRLLPLQTSPPKLEPASASSTESSFSNFPGAVTPTETTESAIVTSLPTMNGKEWTRPAYILPNDLDPHVAQEDLYHQMYAGDYPEDAPFHLPNVGRIDGSTISNSPRSSRSPISKSSSQESFWFSQAALNTRRPRNAGSVGSLPELMSTKNSRERFDFTVDQCADNSTSSNLSEAPSDSHQTSAAQRRRSPNLAKDAAQKLMLSKVRTAEEPLPPLPSTRDRAISDVTSQTQDSSVAPPAQPVAGRRMRSGSSASNLSARSSRGSYSLIPPPLTTSVRNP